MTGKPKNMAGDLTPEQVVERIIRVDHAGEYGAVRIYQGQRAVLGKSPRIGEALRRMQQQEQEHLEKFSELMSERRVRPTLLQPLWHVLGFALGAGTALLGEKAAMACTVAVEEAIDEHYADQARQLGEGEDALLAVVTEFRGHELEHREMALAEGAESAPGYPVLHAMIKNGSRLAIWLSERL